MNDETRKIYDKFELYVIDTIHRFARPLGLPMGTDLTNIFIDANLIWLSNSDWSDNYTHTVLERKVAYQYPLICKELHNEL